MKNRILKILSILLSSGTACVCLGAPMASSPIEFLSELRQENTKMMSELDQSLDKLMASSNQLDSLREMESRVNFLKNRKKELLSRHEFINRMILQFDKNFRGGDVQEFLKVALREMSQVDVKSDQSPGEQSMWKFLNYLAISIDSLPKGQVDVLKFIEGYMKRSSFLQPIEPQEYLSTLDYYNDSQAQRAQGQSPSDL